jgi:hypothetical protein
MQVTNEHHMTVTAIALSDPGMLATRVRQRRWDARFIAS